MLYILFIAGWVLQYFLWRLYFDDHINEHDWVHVLLNILRWVLFNVRLYTKHCRHFRHLYNLVAMLCVNNCAIMFIGKCSWWWYKCQEVQLLYPDFVEQNINEQLCVLFETNLSFFMNVHNLLGPIANDLCGLTMIVYEQL